MEKQTTNALLMIQPVAFGFNPQTAVNNHFQQRDRTSAVIVQQQALKEFHRITCILSDKGVRPVVVADTPTPHTPDSVFPSNWLSFHSDGTVVLYPMFAENRRLERRADILEQITQEGFTIRRTIDYSHFENERKFLEGTGSMVLDRGNGVAYAALSERTDKDLFLRFCSECRYRPVYFHACQQVGDKRRPVYHTNVMMSVWERFAIVCLDSIDDEHERENLVNSLQANGKEIIPITEDQMHHFAGNMIQVGNGQGGKFLVMSDAACRSLTEKQMDKLASYSRLQVVAIPTIERYGGGSVRCMMAEIFLPEKR